MISLDKIDIQNIVILKRYPEFVRFTSLLERAATTLSVKNATIREDIFIHWNQGRVQELLDILNKIRTAEEDLKQFSKAPQAVKDI